MSLSALSQPKPAGVAEPRPRTPVVSCRTTALSPEDNLFVFVHQRAAIRRKSILGFAQPAASANVVTVVSSGPIWCLSRRPSAIRRRGDRWHPLRQRCRVHPPPGSDLTRNPRPRTLVRSGALSARLWAVPFERTGRGRQGAGYMLLASEQWASITP